MATALHPMLAAGQELRKASVAAARRFTFDIGAQPLASALEAYSSVTGVETLYDSAVARRRLSAPVQGVFTAVDALRMMLIGTSLSARSIARDAVTLEAQPAHVPVVARPAPERSEHRRYFGLIQEALERAFCGDGPVKPGAYRVVLSFEVAVDGRIRQPRIVGTTGGDDLDRMILRRLESVSLESAPPADLPQPIMMAILPRSSGTLLHCEGSR